jgi:hypothetical protein
MHITDPLQIVAGLALPVVFFLFFAWVKQLVDDPSNDTLTVVFGVLVILGIAWIGFPLLVMGADFWAQLASLALG